MKKVFFLLIVVISFASCAKDETFSCDPDANKWAKENYAAIQQMSRVDFLSIGNLVYQRAAYNALTPDQRQSFWIEKMEKVLRIEWTEQESQHIQSLFELIKANVFMFSEKRDENDFEKIEIELYRWTEYAQEELKWDRSLLYAICGTLQEMNEDKKIDTYLQISPNVKNRGESCECSETSDWCNDGIMPTNINVKCKKGVCEYSSLGCGFFLLYDCNGKCEVQ